MVELTGGQLWIGSEECPYETQADMELNGRRDEAEGAPNVQKAVLVDSGMLEIHGKPKLVWTRLAATLPKTPRAEVVGSPIYDVQEDLTMKAGIYITELADDGTLVKNWGRVDGPAKINRMQNNSGNVVILAVSGFVKFGDGSPEEVAGALETLCFNNTRRSALRDMVSGLRIGWAAICAIGSPDLSTEEVGKTQAGRSSTSRLVHQIGSVEFVAQSMVALTGDAIVLTDMLSYASGTVPVLEHLVTMVAPVSDWEAGDRIAIASTDYNLVQNEEFQLMDCPDCEANMVKISGQVLYTHWGEVTDDIDMRAEVAVLTRNVRIYGVMEDACYGDNLCDKYSYDTFGGHVKILSGFETARIENAEFFHMGQQPVLAAYPIHFHMCLDTSAKEVYVRSNSIHDTFSRCVTIHGTHNVTVSNNLGYQHLGHCFFLEDGGEQHNRLEGNLGFGTHAGSLLHTDRFKDVSTFWITNPDNTIVDNAAAGSQGMGFWILMPDLPTGPSANVDMGLVNKQASRTLVKEFRGNVAHSNPAFGFRLDDTLKPDGTTKGLKYMPLVDPTDPESGMAHLQLSDFTGYKNGHSVWIKSLYTTLTNYNIAESPIGILLASSLPGDRSQHRELLRDSRIVGETANKGEPDKAKLRNGTKVQLDRSVEMLGDPNFARIGIAFYRGPVHVWDTTFAGFQHNELRMAGAIGKKFRNPYLSSPISGVRNVAFDFSDPEGGSRYYDGDITEPGYREADGNRHSVILDVDGSLTTYRGASIVRPLPVLMNARCVLLPNWGPGTGLCPDRFIRLQLQGARSADTFITRNDLQGDVTEWANGLMQISYSLNTAESYIMHFNTTVPGSFVLQPYGTQLGLSQMFGVCIGANQEFQVAPDTYTSAGTLDDVLADDNNEKYFYDSAVGVIFFRFTGKYERFDDVTSHCPGELDDDNNGACDRGPLVRLTASNEDGDCRTRAYPTYATEPISSEGALTVPTFP